MNLKQDNPTELSKNPDPKARPRRSPVKVSLTVAVVAVLILTGVVAGLIPRFLQHTELSAETRKLSVPTVTVVSPKPGQSTSNLPLSAEIKPWVEAPIYARANGYLKRRLVDIGAHVQAGQLLAEIDAPELDQELDRGAGPEARPGRSRPRACRRSRPSAGPSLLKTASVSEQENAEKQADFKLKTASAAAARAEVRRLEKLASRIPG